MHGYAGGPDLPALHNKLWLLESDSALLEHARRRFDVDVDNEGDIANNDNGENSNNAADGDDHGNDPPPLHPYRTLDTPSDTTTIPYLEEGTPPPETEQEQQERRLRAYRIKRHWLAREHHRMRMQSRPSHQFAVHAKDLALRMARARHDPTENPLHGYPECELYDLPQHIRVKMVRLCRNEAQQLVRVRWKAQGIWRDAWDALGVPSDAGDAGGYNVWAHEDKNENETISSSINSSFAATPAAASAASAASAPSRPLQQFLAQVATERDLLLNLIPDLDLPRPRKGNNTIFPPGHAAFDTKSAVYYHLLDRYRQQARHNKKHRKALVSANANPDIHAQACNNVRKLWRWIGVWDVRWTVLPGLQWPHEEPLEDYVKRCLIEEGFAEEVANEEAATQDEEHKEGKEDDEDEDESSFGSDDDAEEQKQEASGSGSESLRPSFGLFGPPKRNFKHAPLPRMPGLFDPIPLSGPQPLFGSPPLLSPHLSSQDDDKDDDKDDNKDAGGKNEGAARTNGTVDTEAGDAEAKATAAGPPPTSPIRDGNKTRPSRKRRSLSLAQETVEDENEQQGGGEREGGEGGNGDASRPAARRSKRSKRSKRRRIY